MIYTFFSVVISHSHFSCGAKVCFRFSLAWQCAASSLFAPPPSVFPPSSVLSGSRRPTCVAESAEQPCRRPGAQVGGAAGGKRCHGLSRPGALQPLPSPGSHLHVTSSFLQCRGGGWVCGTWLHLELVPGTVLPLTLPTPLGVGGPLRSVGATVCKCPMGVAKAGTFSLLGRARNLSIRFVT